MKPMFCFYKDQTQFDWIIKKRLYNFRMYSGNGSLVLDKETVSAKYLLWHTHKDKSSGDLWRIANRGPKVFSKENLIKKNYTHPSQDYYSNWVRKSWSKYILVITLGISENLKISTQEMLPQNFSLRV